MPWLDFGREERANPAENPAIPLSDPRVIDYFGGDRETFTGRNVSERSALKLAMVWRCVNLIASTIADLPAILYRDGPGGSRKRATDLPLYKLLRWQPNSSGIARDQGTTAFDFFNALMAHRELWGNGYCEIEFDNAGRPINLWPLLPHETTPVMRSVLDERGRVVAKRKYLRTRLYGEAPRGLPVEGGHVFIPPGRYLHFYGLGYDGKVGYSTIDFARQAIGAGLGMEEFNARLAGQGLNPGYVIFPEVGKPFSEGSAERLQRLIDNETAGLTHAHRAKVFEHAFKLEKIGISPKDAQFLEERDMTGRDIARFFGVPLSLVMDPEKGFSNNSVEGQQLQFLTNCIGPRLTPVEQVLTLTLADPPSLFVEFLAEKMLRADSKTVAEVVKTKIGSGVMTPNEGRRITNLAPSEDPAADELWMPVNYMPLSMFSEGGEAGDGGGEGGGEAGDAALRAHRGRLELRAHAGRARYRIARAYRGIFADAARRFVKREVGVLRRLLTKAQSAPEGFDTAWQRGLEAFYGELRGVIAGSLLPFLISLDEQVVEALRDAEGVDVPDAFADNRKKRAEKYAEIYADHHAERSQGILADRRQKAVEKPIEEVVADLLTLLAEWDERQADKIGSEQAINAATIFAREAMVAAGAVAFVWVTVGKNCPLCNRLAGRRTVVGTPYVAAGETVDPGVEGKAPLTPRRDTNGPPLHQGCDCIEVIG